MELFKKIISVILGLIMLVALIYGVYWLGLELIELLAKLQNEVVAALIGAMATVFVGIAAVIISQKQSKQRDIDESHRPKKVEIYTKFLDAVSGLMAAQNENVSKKGMTDQELVNYLVEFKTELLLWGSPQVIKRQLEFEEVSRSNGNIFTAVNNLYKAIREDIGLSNKGLNSHELVKMYLSDPGELDEILASNKSMQPTAKASAD
ncbi:hypothetical protein [Zobellella iuensis]|uniref:Uncharacterized protein n=1 Tax=Zobellella iuensis TaxID=2803811 RepID=A0ABS1QWZ4_9GAMM|nr:hypothetical protein [Zobellella iuensis]MBL1379391.1 hypothetical protein [Zobellella iuensis]